MTATIKQLRCLRCGHKWYPRTPSKPKTCGNRKCQSPYWDKKRGQKTGRPKSK